MTTDDRGQDSERAHFLEGVKGVIKTPIKKVEVDKRGYNETPAGKIERPKPSPTPPPKKD